MIVCFAADHLGPSLEANIVCSLLQELLGGKTKNALDPTDSLVSTLISCVLRVVANAPFTPTNQVL